MADLKALFKARDDQFSKETFKIFKLIEVTLGCVTAYLSDIDEAVGQGIISWEDTSIVDDMVVVIGMVDYEPNETISLYGQEYKITEENLDEFQRVVHMSVPLDLVEEGSEQNIMDYLYNIGDDKDIDEFSDVITPAAAKLEEEFDLSELTEEQIQSLKLHNPKGGH
jgi:hypothetical protein